MGAQIRTAEDAAQAVLKSCLTGRPWDRQKLEYLIAEATASDSRRAQEGSRALFGTLVEGLSDRFDPVLCDRYVEIFAEVLDRLRPGLTAKSVTARYRRIRKIRPCTLPDDAVRHVFVLSRVTLGADVAVTSTLMAGLKRRFPGAALHLVGSPKCHELFAADLAFHHDEFAYGRRDSLLQKLAGINRLRDLVNRPDAIVVDPDSRLTQLGLVPICDEDRYFYFDSRAYGATTTDTLATLTARWVQETFEVIGACAYVAPVACRFPAADVAISFGVGENPLKRVHGSFERDLVAWLVGEGLTVAIDYGAGGEETERVRAAIAHAGATRHILPFEGSFADFASIIARTPLYIGYDSAGQHVAAACGTDLVTIFAGFANERMLARWRPTGRGAIEVVEVRGEGPAEVFSRVQDAARRLLPCPASA